MIFGNLGVEVGEEPPLSGFEFTIEQKADPRVSEPARPNTSLSGHPCVFSVPNSPTQLLLAEGTPVAPYTNPSLIPESRHFSL